MFGLPKTDVDRHAEIERIVARNNWETSLNRNKIITEYGEFIERHAPVPTRIEDVSVLPYPKETILSALLLEIVRGDVLQIQVLRVCARFLAQFQAGVGCEPLEMIGVDIANLAMPPVNDPEAWQAYLRIICEAEGKTRSRFDEFYKLVEEDLGQIDAQIEVAVALSQEMPEMQKKKVLD